MRNIWDAKFNVMKDKNLFEQLVLSNFDKYFTPLTAFVKQLRQILFPSPNCPFTLPPSEREAGDVLSEYFAVLTAVSSHLQTHPDASLKPLTGAPPDSEQDASNDTEDDTDLEPRRPMDMQWVHLQKEDLEGCDVFDA